MSVAQTAYALSGVEVTMRIVGSVLSLALLALALLVGCSPETAKAPDKSPAPPPVRLAAEHPKPLAPRPRKAEAMPSGAAPSGPRLVQIGDQRRFGNLRWLSPGDVLHTATSTDGPHYPFLYLYRPQDGTRLKPGHRGPLILVNGKVVGFAVPSDPKNVRKLVQKHGHRAYTLTLSALPKDDRQLSAIVAELLHLKSPKLLLSLRTDDLEPRRLPLLKPLFSRLHALRIVFPGSPRYGQTIARRHFRQLIPVLEKMPSIPWLHIVPFGLKAPEVRLLERLDKRAKGRFKLTAFPYTAGPRHARPIPALSMARHLRRLDVSHTPITDPMLLSVGRLKQLRQAILHYTHITDRTLRRLARLPRLEYVMLMGTRINGSGFAAFKGHRRLVEVHASSSKVNDAGVSHLAQIPGLRVLSLRECANVTDAGVARLAQLSQLIELDLGSTKITGAGLRAFAKHRSLSHLSLSSSKVTDNAAAHIGAIPNLELLDLYFTKVTDTTLAYLAGLSHLRVLRLGSTGVRGPGIASLAQLKRLEVLDLNYNKITSASLEPLRGHPTLREIDLRETLVDLKVVDILRSMPSLRRINLTDTKVSYLVEEKLQKELDQRHRARRPQSP